MNNNLTEEQEKKLNDLIKIGKELLEGPKVYINYTGIKEADDLYYDLKKNGHLFVLGCVMDIQIKAERAWKIPYLILKELGGFEFERLLVLSLEDIKNKFSQNKFHRFNEVMANRFYLTIKKIHEDYQNDASKIWKESTSAAEVIRKFLEFEGIGQKIASMAANILVRQYKIPLKNLSAIDISTDTHVIRMMKKLGFAPENASKEYIIFRAREFYPEYPGILDIGLFMMGRAERNLSKQKDAERE
jgi:endonuclease III